MYHIDVRLSSELVEDNDGRRAKHVIPFGPDEHRSGIRVGREMEAGCKERAALSEELADLQASPDEEIRRSTELFRTGSRPATLKRQPNLQERSSVSNVRTSQTRHWKRTRNSACAPRSSLWRLLSRIAVKEKSNLEKKLDALSASEEDAKEHDDWTDLESDLVQRAAEGPQVKTTNWKTL